MVAGEIISEIISAFIPLATSPPSFEYFEINLDSSIPYGFVEMILAS